MQQAQFNASVIGCGMHLSHKGALPGAAMSDARTIRWYELELITSSHQGSIWVDGVSYEGKPGRLFIRKPGMKAYARHQLSSLFIVFDSVFDLKLTEAYKEHPYQDAKPEQIVYLKKRNIFPPFLEQLPPYLDFASHPRITALFHQFLDLKIRQHPQIFLMQRALLYELLALLQQHVHGDMEKTPSMRTVDSVRAWIDVHYADSILLSDLAQIAGFSREYLCRLFRQSTGQSPIDYLISVRLMHARELLIRTEDTIESIALQCGFEHAGHFFSCFKAREGMTPKQYRRASRHHSG